MMLTPCQQKHDFSILALSVRSAKAKQAAQF